MVQFNVHEAESNLSKLLELALEGEDVVISRHGLPVATLTPMAKLAPVPAEAGTGDRVMGQGRGTVKYLSENWNDPMTDEKADAFWEGRW